MSDLTLGLEHAGIAEAALSEHAPKLRRALRALDDAPEGEFLRVLHEPRGLRSINAFCRARSRKLTDVVQLGIGGSSLGAQALCAALLPADHNHRVRPPGLRCHFPDNLDPEGFAALLERLRPDRTLVHIVSKSGGTLETQAQLYALLAHFSRGAKRFPVKNLVITTGSSGTLRDFATREGVPVLDFPGGVPGRYSIFTPSGLLVPALCGVPVARVLAGARAMEALCREDSLLGPAGRLAVLHYLHDRQYGRPIHVEMIYADALLRLGDWFRQIWAESLGKGGRGPTPVVARGTTDQHSQLQLYMAGPDDKLYTFVRVARFRARVRIGRKGAPPAIAGKQMAEVFAAEAEGTRLALVEGGRPLIELGFERISAQSVGELLLLQQLQTALAGALYGVDPFTQPGVDAGKLAALRLLRS